MSYTAEWLEVQFEIRPFTTRNWSDYPGIYIIVRETPDAWEVLYVGETNSFRSRLTSGHEKWIEAEELGATHVHATVMEQEDHRERFESRLIVEYDPPLNR